MQQCSAEESGFERSFHPQVVGDTFVVQHCSAEDFGLGVGFHQRWYAGISSVLHWKDYYAISVQPSHVCNGQFLVAICPGNRR